MTFNDYLLHYFAQTETAIFLALALLSLIIAIGVIVLFDWMLSLNIRGDRRGSFFYSKITNHIERLYSMMFSSTSILSFLAAYYLIDRFVTSGPVREFWDAHSDMLLLAMIVTSCLLNSFTDKILVPLKDLSHEEKASIRMIAMLYIVLIFIYIKFVYENNNYDGFITYFLGLVIGRFVYFDASFKDFVSSVKKAGANLPLLILGLAYAGFMCYVGFTKDFLLIHNGVLVSCYIAHLFIVVAIFILDKSHLLNLIIRKPDM